MLSVITSSILLLMLITVQGLDNTPETRLAGIFALRNILMDTKHVKTRSITYRRYDKKKETSTTLLTISTLSNRKVSENIEPVGTGSAWSKVSLHTAFYSQYSKSERQIATQFSMTQVTMFLGKVGNKSLRLRVDGDVRSKRRPVLEVIEADTTKRPYITRVNYTE